MQNIVYKYEKPLFIIAAILSLVIWAGIVYLSKGVAIGFLVGYIFAYLFIQSGFISHFRGRGALVSDAQFPDIQQRVKHCAEKLGMKKIPHVYILQGDGMLNAFATRFIRSHYIVLLSDVLDALENDPDAVNFYIGHEMGHIRRRHLEWGAFLIPGLCFPLLGAAYSRAREYTCDLHGAACCSEDAAKKGLAVLGVGAKRYRTLDMVQYIKQTATTREFWMSFHELIASYPWLIKRVAAVAPSSVERVPRRNPFAYIPAIFIPNMTITSLAFIYLMGFIVIGVVADKKVRQSFESNLGQLEGAEAADYANMSTKEIIDEIIAEWNSQGEAAIDDITVLKNNYAEGDDTIVFHYLIDPVPPQYDINSVEKALKTMGAQALCFDPGMAIQRERDVSHIHRYYDVNDKMLIEVKVSPQDCPVEENSQSFPAAE